MKIQSITVTTSSFSASLFSLENTIQREMNGAGEYSQPLVLGQSKREELE